MGEGRGGGGFNEQASNFAFINKTRKEGRGCGGGGRAGRGGPHDILPIWIFFQASEAVNMHESMIPATVNVPPTMAQI